MASRLSAFALTVLWACAAARAENAAWTKSYKSCLAGKPSHEEMRSEFAKKPATYAKVPRARFIVLYHQCRALASASDAPCADAAAASWMTMDDHEKLGLDEICRSAYREGALVKALVSKDPEWPRLCRDQVPPDIDGAAVCELLGAGVDRPERIAQGVKKLFTTPPTEARLRRTRIGLRMLVGDAGACALMDPRDASKNDCAEYALFRRAWRARDASLCAGGGVCSEMMGGGAKACEAYYPALRDIYCELRADRTVGRGGSSEWADRGRPDDEP
jgi:hypothetical protein